MFRGADAAVRYVPYGEGGGIHTESGYVTSGVRFYAGVETARVTCRDHPYRDGWGFEEREITVESTAGGGTRSFQFRVIFRDANVIGGLQLHCRTCAFTDRG